MIAPDTKDNKKPTVIKVTAPDVHVVDHTTDVHHIDTSSKSVCLHHNTQILFRSWSPRSWWIPLRISRWSCWYISAWWCSYFWEENLNHRSLVRYPLRTFGTRYNCQTYDCSSRNKRLSTSCWHRTNNWSPPCKRDVITCWNTQFCARRRSIHSLSYTRARYRSSTSYSWRYWKTFRMAHYSRCA